MTMEHETRSWDAPEPADAPTTEVGIGTRAASSATFRGMRRGIATALLAGGLLIVGGVAAVSAADPSASPAPDATQQPADPGSSGTPGGAAPVAPDGARPAAPDGTAPGHRGNCPNDGSGSGSDGSGGSNSSPDASPDASNSDV
jgi:hypothetical protein